MSDAPQGPGWWMADDRRWYAPHERSGTDTTPPTRRPNEPDNAQPDNAVSEPAPTASPELLATTHMTPSTTSAPSGEPISAVISESPTTNHAAAPLRTDEPARASHANRSPNWPVIAFFGIGLAVLGVIVYLIITGGDDTSVATGRAESTSQSVASETTTPPTSNVAEEPTATTGVTVEQPSADVLLFESKISALTPYYNAIIEYTGSGPMDMPEQEAALLGTWWSLADWCIGAGKGSAGPCYDKAAVFLAASLRDPRTINMATWGQPGAIGAVIAGAYDVTNEYLGQPSSSMIPDIMTPGRPGDTVLCEPSCTAVLGG